MWATATLPAAATVTTAASQRQRVLPVPGSSPQRHARPTTTTGARPPGRERHGTAGDPGRVTAMVAARTEATTHPSPPPDTIRGRTHTPNGSQAASAGGTAKTIPSPTEKTIVTVETTATNQQPAPIPGDRKSATANQKQSSSDSPSCDIWQWTICTTRVHCYRRVSTRGQCSWCVN